MKLVVTGLPHRNEAAFGLFLNRFMPGWTWASAPVVPGAVLPKADLIVADLVSLGLAKWTPPNEAELLRLLQDTPAVLLVPSTDRTWPSMGGSSTASHAVVWLAKPYDTQGMQSALQQAAAMVQKSNPAPVAPPITPTITAAPDVEAALPVVKDEDDVNSLSAAQMKARLEALQEVNRHVFLRQLADMLSLNHPFEARFTVQNSLIVHPADGWIATNTPMQVIKRVCQSDALASAVSVREIDTDQAEERAQRLGMPARELDVFLWELMDSLPLNEKAP